MTKTKATYRIPASKLSLPEKANVSEAELRGAELHEARLAEIETSRLATEAATRRADEAHQREMKDAALREARLDVLTGLLAQLLKTLEEFKPILLEKAEWGDLRAKLHRDIFSCLPEDKGERLKVLVDLLKVDLKGGL